MESYLERKATNKSSGLTINIYRYLGAFVQPLSLIVWGNDGHHLK